VLGEKLRSQALVCVLAITRRVSHKGQCAIRADSGQMPGKFESLSQRRFEKLRDTVCKRIHLFLLAEKMFRAFS